MEQPRPKHVVLENKIKSSTVVFRLISTVYIELLHKKTGCQPSR